MKWFFNTFFGKLSAIFLLLMLILGAVQILITTQSAKTLYSSADQKLNLSLASDMAAEFEPFLKDSIDYASIKKTIHYMMVMNPKIEIYLIDGQGKIIAFFAEPQKKVRKEYIDLKPVKKFLNAEAEIPIKGDDPRHPELSKPFSVAPIQIGPDIDGYLYIIIGGELYDSALSASQEEYITSTLTKGLAASLFSAGIIGLTLFFFLTRRIRKMNTVVSKFREGDLNQRIDFKSNDELGLLAESFNQMADRILANIEELKETDRLRRELIANVSHDLRSPLASIRGYLETIQMKDGNLSSIERQHYMDVILDTTTSMEALVEQLFELSKLEARQTKPNFEPFSVVDLVYDVSGKVKPLADSKKIQLHVRANKQLPQVEGDVGMIERVLTNLLDNALRYTPEMGTVRVDVKQEKDQIVVSVTDTGPGIEKENLPLIFNRFYRVEKSRSQSMGGTGLGLSIAKKIVEIHDSDIRVDSELNKGSRFSFTLGVHKKKEVA